MRTYVADMTHLYYYFFFCFFFLFISVASIVDAFSVAGALVIPLLRPRGPGPVTFSM